MKFGFIGQVVLGKKMFENKCHRHAYITPGQGQAIPVCFVFQEASSIKLAICCKLYAFVTVSPFKHIFDQI